MKSILELRFGRILWKVSLANFLLCSAFARTTISQEFSIAEFPELEKECLKAIGNDEKSRMLIARIESKYEDDSIPEAVQMLSSILEGGNMGAGGGWFRPATQRYDWKWLAEKHDIDEEDSLTSEDFTGGTLFFDRLDRNGDGELSQMDLDWSLSNPYLREQSISTSIYRQMDASQDGSLTREELLKFFDRARGDDATLSVDRFRRTVRPNVANGGYLRGDEPTQEKLIRGFFSGELGSMQQGPRAGELAKDFELTTQSGDKTIRLLSQLKDKPVVLVFGNFTCGPFRRNYPDFDEICRRFQDQATFLGVYVREAHPSDGWLMESNTKMGVKIPQPITMEERTAVATRCATELNYTMPLLVDTLDDRVGNMYSGMPARAYVIGKDGIVTYQSGRGPFGFKPAEMEQSLILTLMQ